MPVAASPDARAARTPGLNAQAKSRRRPGGGVHVRLLAVAALALATAGCFSEILPGPPVSTLAFACAAIDPETAERMRIVTYTGEGIVLDLRRPTDALSVQLALVSGRDAGLTSHLVRTLPDEPQGGWNETRLSAWVRDEPFLGRGQVTLRILWLERLGEGNGTGLVAAPGAVVLSQAAIRDGAARLGRGEGDVATAVLLHFAGHALGVTNRGVPVQDPGIQEREGPAGHDADPASVLAFGWEDARTMAWAANATYDRFPDAALADWQAAKAPGGVCEVRR